MPDREPSHELPAVGTDYITIDDPSLRSDDYDTVKEIVATHPVLVEQVIATLKINKKDPRITSNILSAILNKNKHRAVEILHLIEE